MKVIYFLLILLASCSQSIKKANIASASAVVISEMNYRGMQHFKVETGNAVWYIEKQSGGCSSLLDRNGRDWINFKKNGNNSPLLSSDSDYRGLPNLVWQEPGDGTGHPGFNRCITSIVSPNELLVVSLDGKWQFRWIFYDIFTEVVIELTDDSRTYWFLYEGPVAGKFSPISHYWGNDKDGLRDDRPSIFKNGESGNWQWVFFGDNSYSETFFLAQIIPDSIPDYFAYMGNSAEKDILSEDGMNVFGFGRAVETSPLLKGYNRFVAGFFPERINNQEMFKKLELHILQVIPNTN
jgi:hypothetical protein